MKTQKQQIFGVFFSLMAAGFFIVLLWRGLQFDQKKIPSQLLGKISPEVHASWIQGKDQAPFANSEILQLSDFRGKTVVLNFWASWCVSCREEAHELEAFWQKYRAKDIYVIGIAIQDEQATAAAFAREFNKNYILGLDDTGKIAIDYGVTGVPETFIIDSSGKIFAKEVGPVTVSLLEDLMKKEKIL